MYTLNFCGQEWTFPKVVNLLHESMFSHFWVMRLQEGEMNSHQSCFGKVMVSFLQIYDPFSLLPNGMTGKK